jgi:ppGpp synthetase/RelA/SpoT-type nucleotidyltranferase/DNA-binding XRE family transcriptional regulator
MIDSSPPSAEQIKAARALLGWSQTDLATQAGVSPSTVADFERGQGKTAAATVEAIRAAIHAAGVALVADGAIPAKGLAGLKAPMTLAAYEKGGVGQYEKLAQIVASILEAAIRTDPLLHCQAAQTRAKDPRSLKDKIAALQIDETADLRAEVKDLAGVRLVFYSDADVHRFSQSGILRDNFELDFERTRIHYADVADAASNKQFIGYHYVVRLKPDRAKLPEYAEVAGLWCEVQIHTILHHAWAQMAHDITYKRPDVKDVGAEQMKQIDARMTKIMQTYLLPAGFEFQKVKRDFDRLIAGKKLFDENILSEIVAAPDNNQREKLLERFSEDVLELLAPDIADYFADIRKAMLDAATAARATQRKPEMLPLGEDREFEVGPGIEAHKIIEKIVGVLVRLRYVDVEATFDALARLYADAEPGPKGDDERKHVISALEKLARYELRVWSKSGPAVQIILLDRIAKLSEADAETLAPFITEIYAQMLTPEIHGDSSTSDTYTMRYAALPGDKNVARVRAGAIDGLFAQLRNAKTMRARRDIIHAIQNATRTPTRGEYTDEFLTMVLEDSTRIVDLYTTALPNLDDEFKQEIEHDLHFLYRRNDGPIPEKAIAARDVLDLALERFRDTLNADEDFVIFKTLVGFNSVFAHEWDEPEEHWDYEKREAYRDARIEEYASKLTAKTAPRWLKLVQRCASVESEDLATFPAFGRFLRKVGEARPAMAEAWLKPASAEPLSRFLHHLLRGLASKRPEVVAAFADEELRHRRHVGEILCFLHASDDLDIAVAERAAEAAFVIDDRWPTHLALALAVERAGDLGPERARAIFMRALDEAQKRKLQWVTPASRWKEKGLFDALSDADLERVLDALVQVNKIDYHAERMLIHMLPRAGEKVVALFGRRQEYEDAARDDPLNRAYEAFPFRFNKLPEALQAHPAWVVSQALAWTEANPKLSEYKGPAFVARIFKDWSKDVEAALLALFQSGDETKRDFVFDVLNRYENNPASHPLLRDIVAIIGNDEERLKDVRNALRHTGVMWGEFGSANAYRGKLALMDAWVKDERPAVQAFAKTVVRKFANTIAAEQRRAEEDLAMRRLDYDEAPRRDDDKDKIRDDNEEE